MSDKPKLGVTSIPGPQSTGAYRIVCERNRQIIGEQNPVEQDYGQYRRYELIRAALCYILHDMPSKLRLRDGSSSDKPMRLFSESVDELNRRLWPWDRSWWKPDTIQRNLEKAGALLAAHWDMVEYKSSLEDESVGCVGSYKPGEEPIQSVPHVVTERCFKILQDMTKQVRMIRISHAEAENLGQRCAAQMEGLRHQFEAVILFIKRAGGETAPLEAYRIGFAKAMTDPVAAKEREEQRSET